ncbi:RidA family protein [Oscillospiraceae bacterium MB08-C2-2]|nr:RidA family protein [Oscillospiraceae bacterium MB08-C2-2]
MSKKVISTNKAPGAIGPYSQAVAVGDFIYTSGQIPADPATGELETSCIKKATARSLDNVKAILEEAGASMEQVVKTTVFLTDMNDFANVNEVYATYFDGNPPARSCVAVASLPRGVHVEIEVVAYIGK